MLGLEQAHVRGRVPGGLIDGPRAEIGLDDHACQQRAVGLDDRGDARFAVAGALGGVAAQGLLGNPGLARDLQAPHDRRVGILPRGTCARSWGASTARRPRARLSWRPGRSGRSGRACRPAGAHPRSARPHISSARSRSASDPGAWMPVSNSTNPSPDATAQALPWGTPGQGSGRRRRNTPGRSRSPRASSRLRIASATSEETRLLPAEKVAPLGLVFCPV